MNEDFRDDSIRYGCFSKRYRLMFGHRPMCYIPYWAVLRMWLPVAPSARRGCFL